MSLITLSLELALREPGCPICRLRQQSDSRYLFTLLYENVNDGGTRKHLVRGMGLCPEHAWALQATEQEHWHDGLGVGIIYEDLASRVLKTLSEHLDKNSPSRASRRTRLRRQMKRWGSVGRRLSQWLSSPAPGTSLLAKVSPVEGCRACELVGEMEAIYLDWLVQQMTDSKFRGLYAASDGLCLPHLRRALASAEDEQAVRYLVELAVAKLGPLVAGLKEYIRKRDWNNRHEPKYPWEQASWVRAVAFLTGEAPKAEKKEIYRLRREALTDYRIRADATAQERSEEAIQHEPNRPGGGMADPSERATHG
jgi:hypothetical protein